MLWMEITPNAALTPLCSRKAATKAPTVVFVAGFVMRSEMVFVVRWSIGAEQYIAAQAPRECPPDTSM